jgi:hypothetical protein
VSEELTVVDQPVVVDSLVPIHTGADMVEAYDAYVELQNQLDKRMSDAVVNIKGKTFRTKQYWRAIARAFGLSVGVVDQERLVTEDGDWGYLVTYRASAQNGKFADGDGSCMASEKFSGGDTIHNVRSHAHTRAFNRAVSNLCGFGEVSADEINYQTGEVDTAPTATPKAEPKAEPKAKPKAKPKSAPVKAKPQPTAPQSDEQEWIQNVSTIRTLASGTVLYHIESNLRKYTCLDEDARMACEESQSQMCCVEIGWDAGTTKAGKSFNGMNKVTLLVNQLTPDGLRDTEEEVDEVTADDIPF